MRGSGQMRIGELAQRTGTTTRALRYYEQQGLLVSDRRDNGYRDFAEGTVTRVRNIRMLLDIGLNTPDIARFGTCLDTDLHAAPACAEALTNIETRMATVQDQIGALLNVHHRLREHLEELRLRGARAEAQ